MLRIAALNESDSEDDDDSLLSQAHPKASTKEAQEAEAYSLYNEALALLSIGGTAKAKETFLQILKSRLLQEAVPLSTEAEGLVHPGLVLKYSTYKNLANLAAKQDHYEVAMEYYLEAVLIDESDVSIWYKMGKLALQLHNYSLARHAFQQGLECSPNHWPCLDQLISLLYALNIYEQCLCYAARALKRDPGYIKGRVLVRKIFQEQPSLKQATLNTFRSCNPCIFESDLEEDEIDEVISETTAMREKRDEMCQVPPTPSVGLPKPLSEYTWRALGDTLIAVYDYVDSGTPESGITLYDPQHPRICFASRVELTTELYTPDPSEWEKATEALAQESATMIDAESPTAAPVPMETTSPTVTSATESTPTTSSSATVVPASETVVTMTTGAGAELAAANVTSTETVAETEQAADVAMETDISQAMDGGSEEEKEVVIEEENAVVTERKIDEAGEIMMVNAGDTPVPSETMITSHRSAGSKRGRKRKQFFIPPDLDFAYKRRSARVRSTVQKTEEERVNYRQLLTKFLPISLLKIQRIDADDENENCSVALETETPKGESAPAAASDGVVGRTTDAGSTPLLQETEAGDVANFVASCLNNGGIIFLLNQYLVEIAKRGSQKWPEGLATVFVKAYERYRKHFVYPNFLGKDDSEEKIADMALMCLVYGELKMDRWCAQRALCLQTAEEISPKKRISSVHRRSPISHAPITFAPDFPGEYMACDLTYLQGLGVFQKILKDNWLPFGVRVHWLMARFYMLQNLTDRALECLGEVLDILQGSVGGPDVPPPTCLTLPNCRIDNTISQGQVEQQLDTLRRSQSLEEVQKLYDECDFERVVSLLLQTFSGHQGALQSSPHERHAQLQLLQSALLKLADYKRCLEWSEVSLTEALRHFDAAGATTGREDWANTITELLDGVNICLSRQSHVPGVPSRTMVRLTNALIQIITMAMEGPEASAYNFIPTMTPWILLHRLIKHEEKADVCEGEELPASLLLLNVAHEYLGQRGWCMNSAGRLLLFIVEEVWKVLGGGVEDCPPHRHRDDLDQMLAQCFYCLYGHPSKRTRAKHLTDHNVEQISLTWERAELVFEYFKPKTMPEYDSYKTSTVSGELEGLLRRIAVLVPASDKPVNTIESVTAYIEGASSKLPTELDASDSNRPVLCELYYLLADYYFKNKEQAKAIKFYLHDLCVNPQRFDSWAGMALARASRLDQKLNSHELKPDAPIQRQAISTLRCFKHALDLEDTNSKLWIEYGALAYQVHSYYSRQIKQNAWYHFDEDVIETAVENRTEMLQLAERCYTQASAGDTEEQEEWLIHYMFGKITEKMNKSPDVYLEHYKKAAYFLHEDRAKYPKKITYYYNAPYLAVEALEMYYRLHVSILKLLLKATDLSMQPYDVYEKYLQDALDGPFANCLEKERKPERKGSDRLDDDGFASPLILPPGMSPRFDSPTGDFNIRDKAPGRGRRSKRGRLSKLLPDHTYSKAKVSSESSEHEQSSQESIDIPSSSQESIFSSPTRPISTASSSVSVSSTLHSQKLTFKTPDMLALSQSMDKLIQATTVHKHVTHEGKQASVTAPEELDVSSFDPEYKDVPTLDPENMNVHTSDTEALDIPTLEPEQMEISTPDAVASCSEPPVFSLPATDEVKETILSQEQILSLAASAAVKPLTSGLKRAASQGFSMESILGNVITSTLLGADQETPASNTCSTSAPHILSSVISSASDSYDAPVEPVKPFVSTLLSTCSEAATDSGLVKEDLPELLSSSASSSSPTSPEKSVSGQTTPRNGQTSPAGEERASHFSTPDNVPSTSATEESPTSSFLTSQSSGQTSSTSASLTMSQSIIQSNASSNQVPIDVIEEKLLESSVDNTDSQSQSYSSADDEAEEESMDCSQASESLSDVDDNSSIPFHMSQEGSARLYIHREPANITVPQSCHSVPLGAEQMVGPSGRICIPHEVEKGRSSLNVSLETTSQDSESDTSESQSDSESSSVSESDSSVSEVIQLDGTGDDKPVSPSSTSATTSAMTTTAATTTTTTSTVTSTTDFSYGWGSAASSPELLWDPDEILNQSRRSHNYEDDEVVMETEDQAEVTVKVESSDEVVSAIIVSSKPVGADQEESSVKVEVKDRAVEMLEHCVKKEAIDAYEADEEEKPSTSALNAVVRSSAADERMDDVVELSSDDSDEEDDEDDDDSDDYSDDSSDESDEDEDEIIDLDASIEVVEQSSFSVGAIVKQENSEAGGQEPAVSLSADINSLRASAREVTSEHSKQVIDTGNRETDDWKDIDIKNVIADEEGVHAKPAEGVSVESVTELHEENSHKNTLDVVTSKVEIPKSDGRSINVGSITQEKPSANEQDMEVMDSAPMNTVDEDQLSPKIRKESDSREIIDVVNETQQKVDEKTTDEQDATKEQKADLLDPTAKDICDEHESTTEQEDEKHKPITSMEQKSVKQEPTIHKDGDTMAPEEQQPEKQMEAAKEAETKMTMDTITGRESCAPDKPGHTDKQPAPVEDKQPAPVEDKQPAPVEDKESVPSGPLVALSAKERHLQCVDKCLAGLRLCLSRFPQHYKSLYRLSHAYFTLPHIKDVQKCEDLLLGNSMWQQLDHMSSPGLFQDHKQTNFFQGLWRSPIEEIDRAGSFAAHLTRSLNLLIDILREQRDFKMLYHLHKQLAKTPDMGKKYVRDGERVYLCDRTFAQCVDAIVACIPDAVTADETARSKFLMEVHKIWQHGVKAQLMVKLVNAVFTNAYTACFKTQILTSPTPLEQAIRYCQMLQQQRAPSLHRPSTPPTSEHPTTIPTTEGLFERIRASYPVTTTSTTVMTSQKSPKKDQSAASKDRSIGSMGPTELKTNLLGQSFPQKGEVSGAPNAPERSGQKAMPILSPVYGSSIGGPSRWAGDQGGTRAPSSPPVLKQAMPVSATAPMDLSTKSSKPSLSKPALSKMYTHSKPGPSMALAKSKSGHHKHVYSPVKRLDHGSKAHTKASKSLAAQVAKSFTSPVSRTSTQPQHQVKAHASSHSTETRPSTTTTQSSTQAATKSDMEAAYAHMFATQLATAQSSASAAPMATAMAELSKQMAAAQYTQYSMELMQQMMIARAAEYQQIQDYMYASAAVAQQVAASTAATSPAVGVASGMAHKSPKQTTQHKPHQTASAAKITKPSSAAVTHTSPVASMKQTPPTHLAPSSKLSAPPQKYQSPAMSLTKFRPKLPTEAKSPTPAAAAASSSALEQMLMDTQQTRGPSRPRDSATVSRSQFAIPNSPGVSRSPRALMASPVRSSDSSDVIIISSSQESDDEDM